jgi:hypothetical protein
MGDYTSSKQVSKKSGNESGMHYSGSGFTTHKRILPEIGVRLVGLDEEVKHLLVSVLRGYMERCVATVRSENRAIVKGKKGIFWIFYFFMYVYRTVPDKHWSVKKDH